MCSSKKCDHWGDSALISGFKSDRIVFAEFAVGTSYGFYIHFSYDYCGTFIIVVAVLVKWKRYVEQ